MRVLHLVPNTRIARFVKNALKASNNTIIVRTFPTVLAFGAINTNAKSLSFLNDDFDRFVVWHGNDIESKLWLYYCTTQIVPLYHIDVSRYYKFLNKHYAIQKGQKLISCGNMAEIGIRLMANKEKRASLLQRLIWKLRWSNLITKHKYGIRRQHAFGHIRSIPLDSYDQFILSHCPTKFMKASMCMASIWLIMEQMDIPYELLIARTWYLIWKNKLFVRPVHSNVKMTLSEGAKRTHDPFIINGVDCGDFNNFELARTAN